MIVVKFNFDRITELEVAVDVNSTSAKTLYSTGILSLNESRAMVGAPKVNEERADKHAVPAFLFGDNIQYIEDDVVLDTTTDTQEQPNSSDPQGGTADLNTNLDNESNNG